MARIVCQVLQGPERVTFIWSQDSAPFEPYHLSPTETTRFHQAADEARRALAELLAGKDNNETLARKGHELHELIFRGGADDASARKVQQWFQGIKDVGSLEFVSDLSCPVPWNLIHPDQPKNPPDVQSFWGMRYPLAAGRRVNPLRLEAGISEPDVLLVLAPDLSAEERGIWDGRPDSWRTAASLEDLTREIGSASPDLLCWVGKVQNDTCLRGVLTLGKSQVPLAELRAWIDSSEQGNPEPLFLLHASLENAGEWSGFLTKAATLFPGLISTGPLQRKVLDCLVKGGATLGGLLRDIRRKEGWPALALTAFCPPDLFLGDGSETPEPRTVYELPEQPYRPLASLEREDRPFLAGRDGDVFRFTALLDASPGRLMLMHGAASVGKASFLRAGVVPYLEDDAVGYLALRERSPEEGTTDENDYPVLRIRASKDLAGQMARALCAFCQQPYKFVNPLGESITVPLPLMLKEAVRTRQESSTAIQPASSTTGIRAEGAQDSSAAPSPSPSVDAVTPVEVYEALTADEAFLGRLLDSLTSRLPFTHIVTIEQGEELVTQETGDRRRRDLRMLIQAAATATRCKLILSLRTDFLGRLLHDLNEPKLPPPSEYLLAELDRKQLLELVTLPTSKEPLPFTDKAPHEQYKVSFAEAFANVLVDQVQRQAEDDRQSAVTLLQVVCHNLYERARKRKRQLIDDLDLRPIGGIERVVVKMVDARIRGLNLNGVAVQMAGDGTAAARPGQSRFITNIKEMMGLPTTRKSLRLMLSALCTSQPDGTVTRDTFSLQDIEKEWKGRKKEDAAAAVFEAQKAGLVDVQQLLIDGEEGPHVSLAHDSVARVTQDWSEHKKAGILARSKVIDNWFLALPLIVLATVLGHYFTKRHYAPQIEEAGSEYKKLLEQAGHIAGSKYVGDIAQAEQAWNDGAIDRMGRALLNQQGRRSDQRGFEWYYLWHLANSERLALSEHRSAVGALAVSPDGKLFASAVEGGRPFDHLLVWNLKTGKKHATITQDSAIHSLAFSADGKYLIAAGADKLIRLWETDAGKDGHTYVSKPARILQGHTDAVLAVACPRIIQQPQVKEGKQHKEAKKPGEDAERLAATRKGALVVSAGADKTIIVWDLSKDEKNAIVHTFKDHAAAIQALAFSADNKHLASGDTAGKVIIWDADPFKKAQTMDLAGGTAVNSLAYSPDGKKLFAAGRESTEQTPGLKAGFIRVLDPATSKTLASTVRHQTEVFAVAVSPDGKMLASGGRDHVIRLADAATFLEHGTIKGHMGWVRSLAFSVDGRSLISGSYDTQVKVWHPAPTTGSEVVRLGSGPLSTVVISPDDRYLAAAGKDGRVDVWNIAERKTVHTFKDLKGPIISLAFGKGTKGNRLAIAARTDKDEGLIQVWDISEDKDAIKTASIFKEMGKTATSSMVMSPEGTFLAWAAGTKVERRNLGIGSITEPAKDTDKDKKPVKKEKVDKLTPLDCGKLTVRQLAISPSGELLAAGTSDGSLHVWSATTGEPIPGSPMMAHKEGIISLRFLMPSLITTTTADHTVQRWGIKKNVLKSEIIYRGYPSPVIAVGLSAQPYDVYFKGLLDGTIRVWDDRAQRLTLRGHAGPVRSLAVTSDGETLISASDDGTVRIWRAPLIARKPTAPQGGFVHP